MLQDGKISKYSVELKKPTHSLAQMKHIMYEYISVKFYDLKTKV
jgi:hypothetical protein